MNCTTTAPADIAAVVVVTNPNKRCRDVDVDIATKKKKNFKRSIKRCDDYLNDNCHLDDFEHYFDIEEIKESYEKSDIAALLDESTVEIWINLMLDRMLLGKQLDTIKNPLFGQFHDSVWEMYDGNFLSDWDGDNKAMCIALKRRTKQHAKEIVEMVKNYK